MVFIDKVKRLYLHKLESEDIFKLMVDHLIIIRPCRITKSLDPNRFGWSCWLLFLLLVVRIDMETFHLLGSNVYFPLQ